MITSKDGGGTSSPAHLNSRSLLSPPASPGPMPLAHVGVSATRPALGDFTRLFAAKHEPRFQLTEPVSGHPVVDHSALDSTNVEAVKPGDSHKQSCRYEAMRQSEMASSIVGLGDFAKIYARLGAINRDDCLSDPCQTSTPASQPFHISPPTEFKGEAGLFSSVSGRYSARARLSPPLTAPDLEYESERTSSEFDTVLSPVPPVTPPTSCEGDDPPHTKEQADTVLALEAHVRRAKEAFVQAQLEQDGLLRNDWLCDYFTPNSHGVRAPIKEKLWTKAEAYASLCANLAPHRSVDRQLKQTCPRVVANGIHIFLDYSNINISFQQFLKSHYKLPENARLSPTPNINLNFLHHLLLRDRQPQTLFAGGSIGQSDKQEPAFVKELRRLDYVVDLRERVRVEEPSVRGLRRSGGKSSGDERANKYTKSSKTAVKFKEEFVDEGLQSRIAAVTLDYLDSPGTLVFVTGDGKPAPYADGFVRYAERALRRGYHVEVVSWSRSLSAAWDEIRDLDEWEGKFRILELDAFWKDLIPCFASKVAG